MKRLLAVLVFAFAHLAPAQSAEAAFPERGIRILTGFPAGSAAELTLRALVQQASKYIDKPLIIVNKPGGAQTLAMTELANAEPDGYTIGMSTDGFKSLTVLQHKVRFDPEDLQVLLGYSQFKHVLFVRGDSPYRKYEDYLAFAKKNPGAMEYGGTGTGTAPDRLGKVLARDAGMKLTYVPFKGSNEYVPAVMGGHVKSAVIAISGISQHVKDGSLGLVLVFGDERLPEYPDVPTSEEKGVRDLSALNSVLTLVVLKGTPADRVKVLHDAFRKAAEDPEFRKSVEPTGLTAAYFPPEKVDQRIRDARKLGVPMLKELNLLVE